MKLWVRIRAVSVTRAAPDPRAAADVVREPAERAVATIDQVREAPDRSVPTVQQIRPPTRRPDDLTYLTLAGRATQTETPETEVERGAVTLTEILKLRPTGVELRGPVIESPSLFEATVATVTLTSSVAVTAS